MNKRRFKGGRTLSSACSACFSACGGERKRATCKRGDQQVRDQQQSKVGEVAQPPSFAAILQSGEKPHAIQRPSLGRAGGRGGGARGAAANAPLGGPAPKKNGDAGMGLHPTPTIRPEVKGRPSASRLLAVFTRSLPLGGPGRGEERVARRPTRRRVGERPMPPDRDEAWKPPRLTLAAMVLTHLPSAPPSPPHGPDFGRTRRARNSAFVSAKALRSASTSEAPAARDARRPPSSPSMAPMRACDAAIVFSSSPTCGGAEGRGGRERKARVSAWGQSPKGRARLLDWGGRRTPPGSHIR